MKKLILPALLGVALLCGCAHQYVIRLANGRQIVTASKPKLQGASYYWKDAAGQVNSIQAMRVREILPASMAREEKPMFKPSSSK